MDVQELDVLELPDGRQVTVLEVYPGGYYVEYQNPATGESDFFLLAKEQPVNVVWRAGSK